MNLYQNENPATYPKNKYLYNGKEIQNDELNGKFFGMLDYGWRFYDSQIARFHSIDRLADKFVYMTPYQYASNEPVRNIDLDGLEAVSAASVPGAVLNPGQGYLMAKAREGKITGADIEYARQMDRAADRGTLIGAKYVGIGVSMLSSIGLIFGPSMFGLNVVKDVLPNNDNAKKLPSNPIGAGGMVYDAFSEVATGKETDMGKKAGELLLDAVTVRNPLDLVNMLTGILGISNTSIFETDNNVQVTPEQDKKEETNQNKNNSNNCVERNNEQQTYDWWSLPISY